MKYLYAAQDAGAKLVVIDPVFTQTAAKADEYLQVAAGGDGALALGMCRHLLDKEMYDKQWLAANSVGFEEFDIEYNWCSFHKTLMYGCK